MVDLTVIGIEHFYKNMVERLHSPQGAKMLRGQHELNNYRTLYFPNAACVRSKIKSFQIMLPKSKQNTYIKALYEVWVCDPV